METSPRYCADELLEVIPLVMRVIRARVRSHSSPELSMPQFRALAFLGRNRRAMLGDVGNFLALSLPAASKLIDGLVGAGLAARETDPADRRRVSLTLTGAGRRRYAAALKSSAEFLAARVQRLTPAERAGVARAMRSLRSIFDDPPPELQPGGPAPSRRAPAAR
jgi:DNA-binding MarR family transcriptional regulator